jgi:hypothetical protein
MQEPLLETAEVRWFFDPGLVQELCTWFDDRFGTVGPENRTDRYLVLPARGAVGIKLREGAGLEIKVQSREPRHVSLTPAVQGVLEWWVKWSSWDSEVGAAMMRASRTHTRWIDVSKRRRLWPLPVDRAVSSPHGAGGALGGGGHLEVTDVIAEGRHAGTLALEMWGEADGGGRTVAALGEAAFAGTSGFPLTLSIANSRSYPRWLEESFADGGASRDS